MQNNGKSDIFELIINSQQDQGNLILATKSDKQIPEEWQDNHGEGQLSVDVSETEKELVVFSTMAGAEPTKIEVYIHNDLLTIRGERIYPLQSERNVKHYHQECFWGKFSRTVILPKEIKADLTRAEYKNGLLTISLPKRKEDARIPVMIID